MRFGELGDFAYYCQTVPGSHRTVAQAFREQTAMIEAMGTNAQKFEETGRTLWAWLAPVLVKLWLNFAFFFR